MTRKVGQHHGDLRRALLDAALALVAEGDIERLSLRAVARRAGVSPGAPYHHFADKTALLAEVGREGFVALSELQASHREPDPADRLEAMAGDYVRFAWAHATHYAVMFRRHPGQVEGETAEALARAGRGTLTTLVAAHIAANPALSPAEALRRSLMAWSLAHGVVQLRAWAMSADPSASVERLASDVGRAVRQLALIAPAPAALGRAPASARPGPHQRQPSDGANIDTSEV